MKIKSQLILLIFVFLSACDDPYNKTINEFKKSEHMKELAECLGVSGSYSIKMFDAAEGKLNSDRTPMLKITLKKKFNEKEDTIDLYYAYNKQTYIFKFEDFSKDGAWKYSDFCGKSTKISINKVPIDTSSEISQKSQSSTSTLNRSNDPQEESRQVNANELISKMSEITCSPKDSATATLYADPNISSDKWKENIGTAWSFIHHSTHKIAGKNYHKGHLVSPRGGHQSEVGFIDTENWDCFKK